MINLLDDLPSKFAGVACTAPHSLGRRAGFYDLTAAGRLVSERGIERLIHLHANTTQNCPSRGAVNFFSGDCLWA